MPKCFCISKGCNGRDLNPRTVQNHKRDDDRAQTTAALAASEAANKLCQDQDAELAAYISSLTLSDNIPKPTSRVPREEALESQDDILASSSQTPSEDNALGLRDQEAAVLPKFTDHNKLELSIRLLSELDSDLLLLSANVESRLSEINMPEYQSSSFPLAAELVAARNIQDRLSDISCNAPTAQTAKKPIIERLKTLLVTIKTAQRLWIRAAKRSPHKPIANANMVYSTGQ